MKIPYVRLYADADGESHFADEEMELKSVNFAPPAPPVHVSAFTKAEHFVVLHTSSGWFGDWPPTPYRQFFFFLTGEVEVRVSDGEMRRFVPGTVLLVEDIKGKGHTTHVTAPFWSRARHCGPPYAGWWGVGRSWRGVHKTGWVVEPVNPSNNLQRRKGCRRQPYNGAGGAHEI